MRTMAVKDTQNLVAWTHWPADIAARKPEAIRDWTSRLAPEIEAIKYWQFEFTHQWQALREYAGERNIRIIGDIPIYVAHDSADVWANRDFFWLDDKGNASKISGVPPDYFSATGQLWGNPIYNWELLKKTNYKWWVDRFRSAMRLYDIMADQHHLRFPLLSDFHNEVARQFGLVYRVPDEQQALYRRTFVNLPLANGDDSWELPIPVTFVVNQDGTISSADANPDYTVRPEPLEILARLEYDRS